MNTARTFEVGDRVRVTRGATSWLGARGVMVARSTEFAAPGHMDWWVRVNLGSVRETRELLVSEDEITPLTALELLAEIRGIT